MRYFNFYSERNGIPLSATLLYLKNIYCPEDDRLTVETCCRNVTWLCVYTGCPRRNVPEFGRVFLMLKYTDITQNTYVQSWTFTEIMAREVWNFDSCCTLIDYQIHIKPGSNTWFL